MGYCAGNGADFPGPDLAMESRRIISIRVEAEATVHFNRPLGIKPMMPVAAIAENLFREEWEASKLRNMWFGEVAAKAFGLVASKT